PARLAAPPPPQRLPPRRPRRAAPAAADRRPGRLRQRRQRPAQAHRPGGRAATASRPAVRRRVARLPRRLPAPPLLHRAVAAGAGHLPPARPHAAPPGAAGPGRRPLDQAPPMLSFEYPWAALLLPLPLLVWLLWPRATRSEAALRVPFFEQLLQEGAASAGGHRPPLWRALPLVLWWLLLVAAACGPRWVGDAIALPASGRDLLLAVDISGSMQIEDMVIGNERVQRLVAVKAVVEEFIRHRRGDRVGLILFGTQAYL